MSRDSGARRVRESDCHAHATETEGDRLKHREAGNIRKYKKQNWVMAISLIVPSLGTLSQVGGRGLEEGLPVAWELKIGKARQGRSRRPWVDDRGQDRWAAQVWTKAWMLVRQMELLWRPAM